MKHTLRTLTLVTALATGLALTACAGPGHIRASARIDVPVPTLVHVGPGVWVVEDYDRPIFYHDGWYWLYSDGVWMRSRVHTGSFTRVRASVVPRVVVRIDRPRRYIRYKARGNVRVRRGPPPHANAKRARRGHSHQRHERHRDRR